MCVCLELSRECDVKVIDVEVVVVVVNVGMPCHHGASHITTWKNPTGDRRRFNCQGEIFVVVSLCLFVPCLCMFTKLFFYQKWLSLLAAGLV